MSDRTDRGGKRVPVDVGIGLGSLGLLWLVALAPVVSETPFRVVVTLVVTLVVPGYALVAVLFPDRGDETAESATTAVGIDTFERLLLSFGGSLALVIGIALVLNFSTWGLRLVPILAGLTLVTGPLLLVAAWRRRGLPAGERFDPHPKQWLRGAAAGLRAPTDRADAVLTVVLVVSIALAAGSVAYAATSPPPEDRFTEFYLLTENESGELYAGGYPTTLTTGESSPLVVGIGNSEGERRTYTVVTELQRVRVEDSETAILDRVELDRATRTVGPGETVRVRQRVVPEDLTGEDLRLQFRLYRGAGPPAGEFAESYRSLQLWVDVKNASDGQR